MTDVVLTHLHVDHVGGLLADGLRGRLRPDVPIHLAAAEGGRILGVGRFLPATLLAGFRTCSVSQERFVDVYRSQLRPLKKEYEVARGWSSVAPAATPLGTAS